MNNILKGKGLPELTKSKFLPIAILIVKVTNFPIVSIVTDSEKQDF